MEYLTTNGIAQGYGGISHTVARHRRTYYATESEKITLLLDAFHKNTLIRTIK